MLSLNKEEKKVEYIELGYDLVFGYMVGRNNSLLGHIEGGFISLHAFAAYALCTLAIIQIWNFTTFYVNMFGRNGARDHVCLFINMYLMYFLGEATRLDWYSYQAQYHIAWALILINIGTQYLIEMRNHKADVWNRDYIVRMIYVLFAEAAVVLVAAFISPAVSPWMSLLAIMTGIVMTALSRSKSPGGAIDFTHLSERAMLYVVFTFGEMIITIAAYFEGDGSFDWSVIFFSLMGFLIVAGLFFSYEIIYDYLLDRESDDSGMLYMIIHIFIVFALNNITVSLEFMREPHVALLPKTLFITVSIVAYFVCLFLTRGYAKLECPLNKAVIMRLLAATAVFAALMILTRANGYFSIAVTVAYVWGIVAMLNQFRREVIKAESSEAGE